jgi:hypothetical protein
VGVVGAGELAELAVLPQALANIVRANPIIAKKTRFEENMIRNPPEKEMMIYSGKHHNQWLL